MIDNYSDDRNLINLIENGFNFLEKGIGQFDSEPKYSVINFCVAIELLLKAKLMSEHWSLIVKQTSNTHPNREKFLNGNFNSINFVELMPKIEAVTGYKFADEAKKSFNQLASHRNQMIHFYHEIDTAEGNQNLKNNVAREQCLGLFHLQRLLRDWKGVFTQFEIRMTNLNYRMKRYHQYLQAIYDSIQPELAREEKAEGIKFELCTVCGHLGSVETEETELVYSNSCRVCLAKHEQIHIPCLDESCSEILKLEVGEQSVTCPKCRIEVDHEYISEIIDDASLDFQRSYDDHLIINCANCSGSNVIQHTEKYYVCPDCFISSVTFGVCGWCNEGQIDGGDLEFSYGSGCESCDGARAWERD